MFTLNTLFLNNINIVSDGKKKTRMREKEKKEKLPSVDVLHKVVMKNERKKNIKPFRSVDAFSRTTKSIILRIKMKYEVEVRGRRLVIQFMSFSRRDLFLVRSSLVNTKRRLNVSEHVFFPFKASRCDFLKTI
jgi:hypothetical protein